MSQNQCGCGGKGPLPEVTFSTFVLSLASAALVHLGEVADPAECKRIADLGIDFLALGCFAVVANIWSLASYRKIS